MIRQCVVALCATGFVSLCAYAGPRADVGAGPTVNMVVTAEARHGNSVASLEAQDVQVTENRKPVPIAGLEPLAGSPAQILLLIDDSARFSFGTELGPIKQFINSLPPNVQVGVGYMRNGYTEFVHPFTQDHAAAAATVRLPMGPGGADVSPYDSLSDAVKKWPSAPDVPRRIAILISSGIEALGGGLAPENPYVNKSIEDAQRAGVIVYGIYNPSVGHFGHVFWRATVGQDLLSQTTDYTGGEAYIDTIGAPAVDFTPFFRGILDSMQHQYLLSFASAPVKKSGLQDVRVRAKEKDVDITAAHAVFVRP